MDFSKKLHERDCYQCGSTFLTSAQFRNYCSPLCRSRMINDVRRHKKLVVKIYNDKLQKYWESIE